MHTLLGFRFAAFAEAFDQQIEHGDEKQIQDRAHDHAAEYRGADGVTSVFAGAAGGDGDDYRRFLEDYEDPKAVIESSSTNWQMSKIQNLTPVKVRH